MELIRKAKCLCKFYNGLNSFLDKNNSLNNNEKVDEFKDTKQSLLRLTVYKLFSKWSKKVKNHLLTICSRVVY